MMINDTDDASFDRYAESYKQQWIEKQLKGRVEEISDGLPMNVFCGTWNVNNKTLEDGTSLNDWIMPKDVPLADIYAVGFQEIVDLSPRNVVLDGSKSHERCDYWQKHVTKALESTGSTYNVLMARNLVGISLYVFVKEILKDHIRDVRSVVTPCGVLGMMGNKGAISVRLNLFDTSLCFVCSHLAANRENVAGRNSDYRFILDKAVFESQYIAPPPVPLVESSAESRRRTWRSVTCTDEVDVTIMEHEYVFWLGDLNYRIDESIATDEVFSLVQEGELDTLLVKDQLTIEKLHGRVFGGYAEGPITFPPTYKYIPGTNELDCRPDKKMRPPAWCDRVLTHISNPSRSGLRQKVYNSIGSMMQSDHKPVHALYECDMRIIIEEKERLLYTELLHTLDKWENDCIPKLEVTGRDVNFGKVNYQMPIERKIIVKNVGSRLARWHFVSSLDVGDAPLAPTATATPASNLDDLLMTSQAPQPICKRFFKISPLMGLLTPAETVEVTVSVHVYNDNLAEQLAIGIESLDDIVVLRLRNGSDFFCMFNGEFEDNRVK